MTSYVILLSQSVLVYYAFRLVIHAIGCLKMYQLLGSCSMIASLIQLSSYVQLIYFVQSHCFLLSRYKFRSTSWGLQVVSLCYHAYFSFYPKLRLPFHRYALLNDYIHILYHLFMYLSSIIFIRDNSIFSCNLFITSKFLN